MAEETPDQATNSPVATAAVFETVSKILASVVVVIYACGFLITSIHDFQYGFSEMNPFRPRILTAGAWFFLFLAVPFALVRQLTKTDTFRKSDIKGIPRLINLSWAYVLSCNFIVFASRPIFRFDVDTVTPPHFVGWKIILGAVGVIALLVVVLKYAKKWPHWVNAVFTAAVLLNIAWGALNDFLNLGQFHSSATILWLLAVGALFAYELTIRAWKPTLGDWPQTLIALLALILIFSTRYYPHILSSWGGGMPIGITITYTKDAVKTPSQDIDYLLIDETDAGFYVVEPDKEAATFVPRASVGMVRFAPLLPNKSR